MNKQLTDNKVAAMLISMRKTFALQVLDSDIDYSHSRAAPLQKDTLVKDSKAYFEKKDVILCRSGIQEYTAAEVARFGLSNPPYHKEVYKVYRPASVIIGSLEKMKNLPITKEHPPEFLNGDNWQRYAHGYTGSEAEITSIGDGEVGVKSKLVFSTSSIYNYYLEGNEEVSLGYQSRNAWVDNPDAVGYDIVMTAIDEVNHCAVTAAGRGGSRVAIIDSLIGGITMFKTGLFHFLKGKGKTTDGATPFSKIVFDSLEAAKTLEGDALAKEVTRVMDSLATLKDGDNKALLMDAVKDCYVAIDTAVANKDAVAKFIDSLYKKAEDETMQSIDAVVKDGDDEKKKAEMKDEDGKGSGTSNISDADTEDADKKKDDEDKEDKKAMDSLQALITDAVAKNNETLLKTFTDLIQKEVKANLGLTNTDSAKGGDVQDSGSGSPLPVVEIAKFVDL